MDFCTCPNPRGGSGTLTDYTGIPTEYRLCADCGLPIATSGKPPINVEWLETVQVRRYAMRRTVRGE